jgi:hypothetical protein
VLQGRPHLLQQRLPVMQRLSRHGYDGLQSSMRSLWMRLRNWVALNVSSLYFALFSITHCKREG